MAFPFLFCQFLCVCDVLEPQGEPWLFQLDNFRSFWNCRVVWAALPAVPALGLSLLELQQENDGEYPAEQPGIPRPHPKGREEQRAQPRAGMGSLGRAGHGRGPAAAGPGPRWVFQGGICPFTPKISLILDLSMKSTRCLLGWSCPLAPKTSLILDISRMSCAGGIQLQGRDGTGMARAG